MLRKMILALALVACGGKSKNGDTPPAAHHDHDRETAMKMPASRPPGLAKFHDLLAPRWHADKGSQRTVDTCNAIAELKAGADAIAKATPPREANADTWTTGTKELVAAVAELEHVCM